MTSVGFPAISELCANPDAFIERLDIGALNLICASGLPGAESLDIAKSMDWLDDAARQVDFQTRRHWYRFVKSPATYHHSPGYFCCYFLLQVLQEEFHVRYNPARVKDPKFQDPRSIDPDFKDSRDLFIHGIIDGPGGTCGSIPVMYVAVGRRLGYPLKLVETKCHLFFRWEDHEGQRFGFPEQFNVEGAGEGIHMHPDQHYREWPEPWTEADAIGGYYLKSLTPSHELAGFLVTRGECLADLGRIEETIQCYQWACALAPDDPRYSALLRRYSNRLAQKHLQALEYAAEKRRRLREQIDELTLRNNKPAVPNHSPACQCQQCKEARETLRPLNAPGHLESCQCILCKEARTAAQSVSIPGHTRGCQCALCRECRSTVKPKVPEHGPSCQCLQCKQVRSASSPTVVSGHPPGCRCFHCDQSLRPHWFPR